MLLPTLLAAYLPTLSIAAAILPANSAEKRDTTTTDAADTSEGAPSGWGNPGWGNPGPNSSWLNNNPWGGNHGYGQARQRAQAVKDAFQFAWDGYYKYAFPHDELHPVSNGYGDSRQVGC